MEHYKSSRRICSFVLALLLCFALFPTAALAANLDESNVYSSPMIPDGQNEKHTFTPISTGFYHLLIRSNDYIGTTDFTDSISPIPLDYANRNHEVDNHPEFEHVNPFLLENTAYNLTINGRSNDDPNLHSPWSYSLQVIPPTFIDSDKDYTFTYPGLASAANYINFSPRVSGTYTFNLTADSIFLGIEVYELKNGSVEKIGADATYGARIPFELDRSKVYYLIVKDARDEVSPYSFKLNVKSGNSLPGQDKISRIKFTVPTTFIQLKKSKTIQASITPQNAFNRLLKYKSGNSSVAKVDAAGKVTGQTSGSAKITATTTDGSNLSASYTAIVYKKVSKMPATVKKGEYYLLTPAVSKATGVIKYTSNSKAIAVASSKYLKIAGKGKATITANVQYKSGSKKLYKKFTYKITVK